MTMEPSGNDFSSCCQMLSNARTAFPGWNLPGRRPSLRLFPVSLGRAFATLLTWTATTNGHLKVNRNPELDSEFVNADRWTHEANLLREILLECELTEELKWRQPCYVHAGKNICIIQRMTGFLALMFFKGALLKDPDGVLEAQGPNSRSGYRICFASTADVDRKAKSIRACVRDAIAVEKSGRKVKASTQVEYPEELLVRFRDDPDFKVAFEQLTPGRKRGYVFHFASAKQPATRFARIERCRPKILAGKGHLER